MEIGQRDAKLDTWFTDPTISIKSDQGSYDNLQKAEEVAKDVADSYNEDAVIIEENGEYHVYGTDEIRKEFRGGTSDNTLYGAAEGTYEFIMTDAGDDETERIALPTDYSASASWIRHELNRGNVPYAPDISWQLAKKLESKAWATLMADYANMSYYSQQDFAAKFGDPNISDFNRRAADGAKKIVAVTVQKGMEARLSGKLKEFTKIAENMEYGAKIPGLPKPVKDFFELYQGALENVPKNVAKMLRDPNRAPNEAIWHFANAYEELTGESYDWEDTTKTLFQHIQQVYQ